MKKVISIGEALIDFIPHEKGVALKDVSNFLELQVEHHLMLQQQLQN